MKTNCYNCKFVESDRTCCHPLITKNGVKDYWDNNECSLRDPKWKLRLHKNA